MDLELVLDWMMTSIRSAMESILASDRAFLASDWAIKLLISFLISPIISLIMSSNDGLWAVATDLMGDRSSIVRLVVSCKSLKESRT